MLKPVLPSPMVADGGTVTHTTTPLVGADRDELYQLVLRLKQADLRHRTPSTNKYLAAPNPVAMAWAEDWNLPREVHDFFILEAAV